MIKVSAHTNELDLLLVLMGDSIPNKEVFTMRERLEMRNELELLIGLKLDNIPDEKVIQWTGWIKDPFPELKSDVIRAIRYAVFSNQIL